MVLNSACVNKRSWAETKSGVSCRSCFVDIIDRPNASSSTLDNRKDGHFRTCYNQKSLRHRMDKLEYHEPLTTAPPVAVSGSNFDNLTCRQAMTEP